MVVIMRRSDLKSLLLSFWETLLHPDHEELAMKDRLVVISAANQLQVGEFQLLQLAYRVERMHGRIEVESTKDVGTTVIVTFPARRSVPHHPGFYEQLDLFADTKTQTVES